MTSYDLRTRKDDPAVFEDPMLLSDTAARELLRPVPWRRFAVIGDSIAAGTGDPAIGFAMLPWADRLAGWLRAAHPETRYLNTGRTGATLGEIRAEQLAALHEFHPDLVFVNGGGNDLMRREADLGAVEQDLDRLCGEATATGARLALFTLADAFTGPLQPLRPRFAAFAEAVRRTAARHDGILVEFWGHPARLRPDWLSADRIHLTMAGQAIVAAELAKSLARHADSGPDGE